MKEKITTIKVWDKKYRLIPFLVLLFLFLALVIFILGVCYRLSEEFNKKGPCNECHENLNKAGGEIEQLKLENEKQKILLVEKEETVKEYVYNYAMAENKIKQLEDEKVIILEEEEEEKNKK